MRKPLYIVKSPLSRLTLLTVLLWAIAGGAYALVVARGWRSTHQGYAGDDRQLYEGVHHLLSYHSFYAPTINAYPPAMAWFYAPFALFSWPRAHDLWFLFSTGVCLPCLGLTLYYQFGRRLPQYTLPLWLALLFLSAPPYLVAYFGQLFFPMTLALVVAWRWAYSHRRRTKWAAGLLYAVALTKPTISLPFFIYQLLRRPTRAAAGYGLLITLVLTLATAVIYPHPTQMVREYRATIHSFVTPGACNDTGFTNPRRNFLLNMGVLFFDIVRRVDGEQQTVETAGEICAEQILEAGFALCACGLFAMAFQRNLFESRANGPQGNGTAYAEEAADDWAFAALTLLAMLLFYHAWTDFGMLYLPLIVVLNFLAGRPKGGKILAGILTATLLLILFVLARNHTVYAWQPNVTRLLLVIIFCQCLYFEFRTRASQNESR